jgi:hypothetical protein
MRAAVMSLITIICSRCGYSRGLPQHETPLRAYVLRDSEDAVVSLGNSVSKDSRNMQMAMRKCVEVEHCLQHAGKFTRYWAFPSLAL